VGDEMIEGLNYKKEEIDKILQLINATYERKYLDSVSTKVRADILMKMMYKEDLKEEIWENAFNSAYEKVRGMTYNELFFDEIAFFDKLNDKKLGN
jgi:hypothetical protein